MELQQHIAILTVTVIISNTFLQYIEVSFQIQSRILLATYPTVRTASTQAISAGSTQQPPGSTLPTTTPPTIGYMGAKCWPSTTRPMVCNTQALGCYNIVNYTVQSLLDCTHADLPMQHYMTVFKQNIGCGYILKPQVHSNCKCLCRWVVRGA